MSNYLNNLAARALLRQEPVRPRLASLFEPPVGALATGPAVEPPDALTTSLETDSPVQAASAAETIRTPTPSATPRHDDSPPHTQREGRPPESSPRPWLGALESEAAREGRGVTPSVSSGRESTEEGGVPSAAADRDDAATRQQRGLAESLARREAVGHERRGATDPEARADVRASAEEEGRVAPLEASRVNDGGRGETAMPAPVSVVRAVRRSATPPVAPARGSEPTDEPPHVTVTIGRVDVRAVFPAPAAVPRPPAPRPGPKTTLDEYLKQRERGQR